MFKVSKKNTRTMCQIYSKLTVKITEQRLVLLLLTLSIFCIYLHFIIIIIILEFNQINIGWASKTIVSDNKILFSNWEKYIDLWAGEICWATYFHSFSLNIRLGKDIFSWQHFKKINRTLLYRFLHINRYL